MRKLNLVIKRIIDIFSSLIGLIILLPIIGIFSLIIKLTSKGPVFFKQERLGKDGKTFKIIKFRTMIENAENIGDGLKVKSNQDPRITKIGKFLRRTSLDEIPQLWNVLKGDMSLVGPRPPVPYHPYKYNEYSPEQKIRFEMRPGITGLAQVVVRNSAPWDERINLDIRYVKEFNLLLDIKILIQTFFKVFKSESIYLERRDVDESKDKKIY